MKPHIVLLCATRRGLLSLERLADLLPGANLTVFSFREEPWEPPFLNDIRELTFSRRGSFIEARQIGGKQLSEFWTSTFVDLMFVISWRYLIPKTIYARPRLGTFVFHDSLLPEYRGFSPTVWAIVNGEDHTGVTLFEIAERVDAGRIVDQEHVAIGADDAVCVVMEQVTETYLRLLERNLDKLLDGTASRSKQEEQRASYTCKRLPEDNRIDWTQTSEQIFNLVRAVSRPYSGAYTHFSGKKITIWKAQRILDAPRYLGRIPGRIVEVLPGKGCVVLTGDGVLLIQDVQIENGEICTADEVLRNMSCTLGA